jgi:hypothetical protein
VGGVGIKWAEATRKVKKAQTRNSWKRDFGPLFLGRQVPFRPHFRFSRPPTCDFQNLKGLEPLKYMCASRAPSKPGIKHFKPGGGRSEPGDSSTQCLRAQEHRRRPGEQLTQQWNSRLEGGARGRGRGQARAKGGGGYLLFIQFRAPRKSRAARDGN